MSEQEKAYVSKEVRITLDIGDSTLRKWCLSLEKNGYHFSRNEQNRRFFVEADLVVLRHFQTLVQESHMPMDKASSVIVSRFGSGACESSMPSVLEKNEDENRPLERSDELIEELLQRVTEQEEYIKKQEQFNEKLLARLDQRDQYVEERLNQRDEKLMQSLREVQETKLLLAATQENKKKWFEFWK